MRKESTPEEKFAKEILERFIYKDKILKNDDKPDIQSLDKTVGIEHMLLTTGTSEMQAKMQKEIEENQTSLSSALKKQKKDFGKSDFGYLVNDNGDIYGLSSFPKDSLLEMIESAFAEKYPKINNGSYKKFDKYDLFLTLHNNWISNDDFSKVTSKIEEYNQKFKVHYHRIFILKSYSLLVFENDTCKEMFFTERDLTKKWY